MGSGEEECGDDGETEEESKLAEGETARRVTFAGPVADQPGPCSLHRPVSEPSLRALGPGRASPRD